MRKGTAFKTSKTNVMAIDLGRERGYIYAKVESADKRHGGVYLGLTPVNGSAISVQDDVYTAKNIDDVVISTYVPACTIAALMVGTKTSVFIKPDSMHRDLNSLCLFDYLRALDNLSSQRGARPVSDYVKSRISHVAELSGQKEKKYRDAFEARINAFVYEMEDTLSMTLIDEIVSYLRALDTRILAK